MLLANILKMPLPGQMIMSFLCHEVMFASVHVTDDVRFCDGLGMLINT